jgi:hypothetical protein
MGAPDGCCQFSRVQRATLLAERLVRVTDPDVLGRDRCLAGEICVPTAEASPFDVSKGRTFHPGGISADHPARSW